MKETSTVNIRTRGKYRARRVSLDNFYGIANLCEYDYFVTHIANSVIFSDQPCLKIFFIIIILE